MQSTLVAPIYDDADDIKSKSSIYIENDETFAVNLNKSNNIYKL